MYRGQTYQIPCDIGGLNHNKNIDLIPPEAMVDGTKNININEGGRGKRGGTAIVNASPTPIAGTTPRIMGVSDFILENGNSLVVVATDESAIYKDDVGGSGDWGTDITNVGSWATDHSTYPVHMITAGNLLLITDGKNFPQTWDGSAGTTSDITSKSADWSVAGGGTNEPRGMVARTRSFSGTGIRTERVWAWGCLSNPNRLYFGENYGGTPANLTDFSSDNSIEILMGDGDGVIAMAEFGDRLFAFGRKRTFYIDDDSATIANWGVNPAQFTGGLGGQRLVVNTPFDLVAMAEDGEIYSVITAEQYGDYKSASLTAQSFIHNWIKDNVDLTYINDFHAIYDPVLRVLMFYVVRKNTTYVDTCLMYFIDRGPKDGWMIHDNKANDSGYKASSSALVRTDIGTYKIFTGGWSDGYVWRLNNTVLSDGGNAYTALFKTARDPFGDPRMDKRYDKGRIITSAKGDYTINIDIWVDGIALETKTVSLAGSNNTYDSSATYGVDASAGIYGGDELIDTSFDIGVTGKRIQYQISNNNVGEDFFISQILTDFKPLGRSAN